MEMSQWTIGASFIDAIHPNSSAEDGDKPPNIVGPTESVSFNNRLRIISPTNNRFVIVSRGEWMIRRVWIDKRPRRVIVLFSHIKVVPLYLLRFLIILIWFRLCIVEPLAETCFHQKNLNVTTITRQFIRWGILFPSFSNSKTNNLHF